MRLSAPWLNYTHLQVKGPKISLIKNKSNQERVPKEKIFPEDINRFGIKTKRLSDSLIQKLP